MAKIKYDGVIEAVRYTPNGLVDWVRVYERRGPAFSDHVKLTRSELIARIKSGKKFVAGRRLANLGGSFETGQPLRLVESNGKDLLAFDQPHSEHDKLDGIPLI